MSQNKKSTPKPSPKNTLFNYFAKNNTTTPQTAEKKVTENLQGKQLDFGKRSVLDSSDEEEKINPPTLKKRKIIIDSDDDQENTENAAPVPAATSKRVNEEPIAKIQTPKAKIAKKTPSKSKEDDDSPAAEKESLMKVDNLNKVWLHDTLDFLKPDQIRDKNKRKPNDPDYDPRTVFVPIDFIKKQTPGMAQWWTLKSDHFDCVLFFKVGKFYELYHHDAITGVNELGFNFMGSNDWAHSGFPESGYEKMASQLIDKGYRVARVEQTENPAMMEERCKRDGTKDKFSKVMKREICQITDRGTQIFSNGQSKMTSSYDPNYLLAITERKLTSATSRYGICFVDTSIGDFTLGEFDDDQQSSRLLTMLAHYSPVLVLYERNGKAQHTEKIIKAINALKEPLTKDKQMWNGSKVLKYLSEKFYSDQETFPPCLKDLRDSQESDLALQALGGCLWYLERNLLVSQVLSLATFKLYIPPDHKIDQKVKEFRQKFMILDNITLSNLNVVSKDSSLFMKMDYCCTQFGKRLLMDYLCSPSADIHEIRHRQEAVKELHQNAELLQNLRTLLNSLNVDMERSLAQVHQFGNSAAMKDHPNSRAILYETATYGRNKISDFAGLLKAFEIVMQLPAMFADCQSSMLKTLTQTNDNGGMFEDMTKQIEKFSNAFDIDEAKKTGFAVPEKHADQEYDEILNEIDELEVEIQDYLKEQERVIGCKLKYFGTDRKRYQIEVPVAKSSKVPSEYTLESAGGKSAKRFTTSETKEFLKRMQKLEETKKTFLNDFARKIYEKFSLDYTKYKKLCGFVSKLDFLASLAEYSRNQKDICVPEIHEIGSKPGESLLRIKGGIHPMMSSDDFIPNGINIPSNGKSFFELITGPNMGGKSTLMREVALLSIMAQIGSMVPAESMELSIIDRIFTRLGANDNIMANQSTFLVELNETSLILKHCSSNSLVLLDELGRGTSTHDGTAIAQSVANFLANMKCRTLFSTHYHTLVDNFYGDDRIHLGHMACMVENENSEDITKENVTFLYEYTTGSSPKSFGFNAAKLAGIELDIIRRAHEISKKFEAETLKRKITAKILQKGDTQEIKNLLVKYKNIFI